MQFPGRAESVLNVTDFGAIGDATPILVSTVAGSPVVSVDGNDVFSSADIGKVIEVFGAGPQLTYSNWGVVVTQQDIICKIVDVSEGTNLLLSIPCGYTLANAYCVVGVNNVDAFQQAIDTASNIVANGLDTNVTIQIPAGTYLLCSKYVLDPNYVMNSISDSHPALRISSGGITLAGDPSGSTVLMGCGAGMEHMVNQNLNWISPYYAPCVPMRDTLIVCAGPIVNSQYPLVFKNLTFDGGVTNGLLSYNYWTPIQANGLGWDTTHHAVADSNPYANPQMHQLKVFSNCVFQHWRGEILICWTGTGGTNTFVDIGNCTFQDCNATADNMYYGQHVHGCLFKDLVKVIEYYQANATLPTVFEDNMWTNIVSNPLTIVGATIYKNPPSYTIRNNVLYGKSGTQITFSPAENVNVISNVFYGQGANGIGFSGIGVQPSDGSAAVISNIVIACNSFYGSQVPIGMDGTPVTTVIVSNNFAPNLTRAFASAAGGWKNNITFSANVSSGWLDSRGVQVGSFFIDKTNNQFAPVLWTSGLYNSTNALGYGGGRTHKIQNSSAIFYLDDSTPALIPNGALLNVTNSSLSTVVVYTSKQYIGEASSFFGLHTNAQVQIASGTGVTFYWVNGSWQQQLQQPTQTPTLKKKTFNFKKKFPVRKHWSGFNRNFTKWAIR